MRVREVMAGGLVILLSASVALAQTTATQSGSDGALVIAAPGPGLGSGGSVGLVGGVGPTVRGLPYSLVETTTSVKTLADGTTMTNVNEERRMRDGEGRQRVETGRLKDGGFEPEVVTITDPVARTRTLLMLRSSTARVTHFPEPRERARVERTPEQEAQLAEMRSKAAAERADILHRSAPPAIEKLSAQTIAGEFAEGVRMTRVIPEGQDGNDRAITVVTDTWTSPELKLVLRRDVDDPRSGKTTTEVSELTRGEPDAALFQVPGDFKVIEPGTTDAAQEMAPPAQ